MDREINAHSNEHNVVDGINTTDKCYLKEPMELIGKSASNYTSKIGILLSASKYLSIKISDKCIHMINNKYMLNGPKVIKKLN